MTRKKLLKEIRHANLNLENLTLQYSGYGDELSFTEIVEEGEFEHENDLIDFLMEYVNRQNNGFWNNEGGQGTVIWNLVDDVIEVEHGNNYVEVDYQSYNYGNEDVENG